MNPVSSSPADGIASPGALDVVVMAAGKGTRMKSRLPKVLHRLGGRALLERVMDTAASLGTRHVVVVTGHGAEEVEAALSASPDGEKVHFARQTPQLGTGHAVQQAMPHLPDDGTVLVLSGDVPLIGEPALRALVAASGGERLALLTIAFDDPAGYGRVVRAPAGADGAEGRVLSIVEHKDANEGQRAIREVYSGVMAAPARLLRDWLARLPDKQRLVVTRRFGLDNDEPATLETLADELGVTRERVRQIQQEALVKLKRAMAARGVVRDALL